MLLDPEVLGDEIAELVIEQVAKSTAPLIVQMKELRTRLAEIKQPENGKDADPEDIRREVALAISALPTPRDGKDYDQDKLDAAVERAVAARPVRDGRDAAAVDLDEVARRAAGLVPVPLNGRDAAAVDLDEVARRAAGLVPVPLNGKDADAEAIAEEVLEKVLKTLDKLPAPKDGRDGVDGKSPELPDVMGLVKVALDGLDKPRDGVDGKDADPREIAATIAIEVGKAIASLPAPKDGASITVDDVRPLLDAELAKIEVTIERRATDTLQRVIDRMPVPKNGEDGKPGEPGFDGRDGRDATPGRDGHDGFQLDDFEIEAKDDGRMLVFSLRSEKREIVREVRTGYQIYRDVFEAGRQYLRGDTFTYGGSVWHTNRDAGAAARPGDGSGTYTLSVKKGKDGKDAAA